MSEHPQSFHDFGALGQGIYSHGTRQNYRQGCHCLACRSANACYEAARARARAAAPAEALVDAGAAQQRLHALSTAGVGHRQAAQLAGISIRTARRIRTGQSTRISPAVERAILDVTKLRRADGVRVNGYPTRHRLESLLRDGYELATLAAWLGLKGAKIQLHNPCVRLVNALKVQALYRHLRAEQSGNAESECH